MGLESRSEQSSDALETRLKQEPEAEEKPDSSENVPDAPPPPAGDEMATETVSLRPRKSGDGPAAPMAQAVVPPPGFTTQAEKRGRGRPKGSTNKTKQLIASSADDFSAGEDFIPHLLFVRPGEEIGAKSLCVISALGSVSSAILSQPGSSVGSLRHDCECEIQALSGTYTFSETRGVYHKQGILSAALTMPDGEVIGGRVVGPLIASSLVQLVMGSFWQDKVKKLEKKLISYQPSSVSGVVYVDLSSPRSALSNGGKNIPGDTDSFRRM